ncbi:Gfo/Idh/MocA family oxidoreductase [bacterium]|nr:Gfo/Idh/MocA family oxidoreductase [bacterium]
MKRKLRLGLVGSGFVGQLAHIRNYNINPKVTITALAELRPKLGQSVCDRYGIKNYYKNHLDLLKNKDIEAVVAIVNRKHTAYIARDILKKGFNLFTEKPMAATFNEAQELVNLSKKKKCKYVIGNMRRHDEGVQNAYSLFQKLIKENKLGKIIYFRSYCYAGGDYCNIDGEITTSEPRPNKRYSPAGPEWLPTKKHSEFERFLNYFIHDINLIRFFFKDNFSIASFKKNKNMSNIIFDYGNFYGSFEGAYLDQNMWDEGLEIFFEKGHMKISLPPAFLRNQPAKIEIYEDQNNSKQISYKSDWTWSFKKQTDDFVDVILKNKSSICSAEDSLKDIKVIEDIWKLD